MIPRKFEGKEVRTVVRDDGPWWVAKDVCDVLGIVNPGSAVALLPDSEKSSIHSMDLGRSGGFAAPIVNEPGLYRLIFKSRKAEAEKFKTWIFSEVLPSIRKTGKYKHRLTEDDIQQRLVKILSYSKHPVQQEQWGLTDSGREIRFDMVYKNSRRVIVMELKLNNITVANVTEKLFTSDYISAIKRLAGKRKVKLWFIGKAIDQDAIRLFENLNISGVSVGATTTESFLSEAGATVRADYKGHDWFYNKELDGQLVLEGAQ